MSKDQDGASGDKNAAHQSPGNPGGARPRRPLMDGDTILTEASIPACTPRLTCVAEVQPDTEDNVVHQTETVLRQFFYERYSSDQDHDRLPSSTPSAPELTQDLPPMFSPEATVGRQLAAIGDDIQQRYNRQFTEMIKTLNLGTSGSSAYETFRSVASKLFRDGTINWGRVVALFCFGYRIAIHQVAHGFSGMIKDIIAWIIEFMMKQRISQWIAEHGGWRAVMSLMPETVNASILLVVAGLALVAVGLTMFLTRK